MSILSKHNRLAWLLRTLFVNRASDANILGVFPLRDVAKAVCSEAPTGQLPVPQRAALPRHGLDRAWTHLSTWTALQGGANNGWVWPTAQCVHVDHGCVATCARTYMYTFTAPIHLVHTHRKRLGSNKHFAVLSTVRLDKISVWNDEILCQVSVLVQLFCFNCRKSAHVFRQPVERCLLDD